MKKGKINRLMIIVIIAGAIISFIGYNKAMKTKDTVSKDINVKKLGYTGNPTVIMNTNLGEVKIELFTKDAPETVGNFIKLSREKFYDGVRFHRVIKGFMIQGGDPNSKDEDWSNDGIGGPGYFFNDEINARKLIRGSLAMANAGPNTNGSQFFIVTALSTPWLDGRHTVFGHVISGMDVVDKIENAATDKSGSDHPLENITIESVAIAD